MQIPLDASPGKVGFGELELDRDVDSSKSSRLRRYKQAFDAAMESSFVSNFWSQEVLENAQATVSTFAVGESVGNAVKGKAISAVLTAGLVAPS